MTTVDEAREALVDAPEGYPLGSHSGACCTFDDAGKVVITDESCKCDAMTRRLRAALPSGREEQEGV